MMQKRRLKMDETIRAYIYTLDCANQRMKCYRDSGDTRLLVDSEMYLRVANIYMKEIISKDATERPQYA
jgi:hypothetical protein